MTPLPESVIAEIPLDPGVAPFGNVWDGRAIWVTVHRGSTIYRIDPATGQIAARIDIGQEACGMPFIASGRILVPPCDTSSKVLAVDTTTDQIVGGFEGNGALAATDDGVWSVSPDGHTLARRDPKTLKQLDSKPLTTGYDGLQATGGTLWGVDSLDDKVERLDLKTGRAIESLVVPGFDTDESLYTTVLDGGLWMKGYKSGALVRMDLGTRKFTVHQIPGYSRTDGYYDLALTAALGSLWFRISDSSVVRFDPASGKVVGTYPAGSGGGAVAVESGSLWVANFDQDTVWRERISR